MAGRIRGPAGILSLDLHVGQAIAQAANRDAEILQVAHTARLLRCSRDTFDVLKDHDARCVTSNVRETSIGRSAGGAAILLKIAGVRRAVLVQGGPVIAREAGYEQVNLLHRDCERGQVVEGCALDLADVAEDELSDRMPLVSSELEASAAEP